MNNIAKEKRRSLNKAFRLVEAFRVLDSEMASQQMATFMIIASNEGCSLGDIADRLGLSQSSASRNVSGLTKVHRLNKPGHDLVDRREDPLERRRKVHTLTPKGKALRDKIIDLMEGD